MKEPIKMTFSKARQKNRTAKDLTADKTGSQRVPKRGTGRGPCPGKTIDGEGGQQSAPRNHLLTTLPNIQQTRDETNLFGFPRAREDSESINEFENENLCSEEEVL